MELLLPRYEPDVDVGALYADPGRRRADRPYVFANMVASADGATAVEGRSGGLNNETDRQLFALLRELAAIVLVGAATVRAERYRPSRVPGQRIAVVTRALDLDFGMELFTEGRGVVVTTLDAGPVPDGVPVIRAGEQSVDFAAALEALGEPTVLTEGGPGIIHQLIGDGLLDELCLTVAPVLVGGRSKRVGSGAGDANLTDMRLVHSAHDGSFLFLRYVRDEDRAQSED